MIASVYSAAGRRSQNQDVGHADEAQRLFIVADGMGGANAGDVAASFAARVAAAAYADHPSQDPGVCLAAAACAANEAVYASAERNPRLRGMGCTLTMLALVRRVGDRPDGFRAYLAHVGDSRCYGAWRDGSGALSLHQLTEDHTVAEEAVRQGHIPRERVRVHTMRHVLTRAVGVHASVETDVSHATALPGDALLLCSDGVHGALDAAALLDLLRDPSTDARRIVQAALEADSDDNATAVLVRV